MQVLYPRVATLLIFVVNSNDPNKPVDTVKVSIEAIGRPFIWASSDSIDFGDAFIGYPNYQIPCCCKHWV